MLFNGHSEKGVATYVAPDGTEYADLDLLQWTQTRDWEEGVQVDPSGVQHEETRTLLFDRGYLVEQGITELNPAGHFVVAGERWDFMEDRPVNVKGGPIAGSHPAITVNVRKAVELNESVPGSEFGYGD